jgi:mannonate dehydratase
MVGVERGAEIRLSEVIAPGQTARMRLLKQVGVNHAIGIVGGLLAKTPRSEYVPALKAFERELAAHGLKLAGVEGHPVPAEKLKLGLPGRDEELENYRAALPALREIGVDMICHNFMAGIGWYRTRTDLAERGGALTSEFNAAVAAAQPLTEHGEISEERSWANMEYFQKAVIPMAEKCGMRMALHPDDPPLAKLRGIARILTSAANYRRVFAMAPSPVNGVTFCQANFVAMGEDVQALAREWLREKKIFFVHFRDVAGTRTHFRETFHDNGPTDMAKMLRIYAEGGFRGPIRPDHAPTLEGESNASPGYAMGGKVFAFGYMIGVMKALGLPYA